MIEADINRSDKADKRYKVVVSDGKRKKTIHFGSKGASTFLEHKDLKIKNAWEARHKVRENWNDPFTAGFWAKWILWNETGLDKSIRDTEKRFNIEIK